MNTLFDSARNRATRARLFAIVAIVLLGLFAAGAAAVERDDRRARDEYGDLVHIFTSDIVIPEGTVRHGSVVCIGGDVRIAGELTGDAIVILGSVEIEGGEVRQSVIGVLTEMELRDAEIRGDLINVAGGLTRENVYIGRELFDLGLIGGWFPGFLALLTWIRVLGIVVVFVVLVLLVAITPERVRLIGRECGPRYLPALLVGLLVYCVLWTLVVPLAIGTLIGIPFLILAWTVVKWLGVAGLFYALGSRIGRSLGREMSPMGAVSLIFAIHAAVLLVLSPLGLIGLAAISAYRTVFLVFVEAPAVGLMLLTRFGSRSSARTEAPPAPPPSPRSPEPPPGPLPPGGPGGPSGERVD
jgi:hypothetical protein